MIFCSRSDPSFSVLREREDSPSLVKAQNMPLSQNNGNQELPIIQVR
jgi:hypothetical protein